MQVSGEGDSFQITTIIFWDLREMRGKSKQYCPKWWFDDDLPWYNPSKKSPSANPSFRVPIFSKTNISLPMKIGRFNAPKGNECIIPTIHFQVLLLMDKIRRSPVDGYFMYHCLQGVYTSQVVVWEFFHQQHVSSREDNFQKEENSTSHRPSRFHRPVFFVGT